MLYSLLVFLSYFMFTIYIIVFCVFPFFACYLSPSPDFEIRYFSILLSLPASTWHALSNACFFTCELKKKILNNLPFLPPQFHTCCHGEMTTPSYAGVPGWGPSKPGGLGPETGTPGAPSSPCLQGTGDSALIWNLALHSPMGKQPKEWTNIVTEQRVPSSPLYWLFLHTHAHTGVQGGLASRSLGKVQWIVRFLCPQTMLRIISPTNLLRTSFLHPALS